MVLIFLFLIYKKQWIFSNNTLKSIYKKNEITIKDILIKLLRPIKRALAFLKLNLSTEIGENPLTPYNLYKKEEIFNSYNYFKNF